MLLPGRLSLPCLFCPWPCPPTHRFWCPPFPRHTAGGAGLHCDAEALYRTARNDTQRGAAAHPRCRCWCSRAGVANTQGPLALPRHPLALGGNTLLLFTPGPVIAPPLPHTPPRPPGAPLAPPGRGGQRAPPPDERRQRLHALRAREEGAAQSRRGSGGGGAATTPVEEGTAQEAQPLGQRQQPGHAGHDTAEHPPQQGGRKRQAQQQARKGTSPLAAAGVGESHPLGSRARPGRGRSRGRQAQRGGKPSAVAPGSP